MTDSPTPDRQRQSGDSSNRRIELNQFSLIRVSGVDAAGFLNAQLTNEIQQVDAGRAQLNAWCNPKGRVLTMLLLLRHGDDFLLQLPAAFRDDILKRLRPYVLRSKVTLASADDAYVRIGVVGPEAASCVRAATGVAPDDDYAVAATNHYLVMRLPGTEPRYQILAAAEAASLLARLRDNTVAADADVWQRHDILAGLPQVWPGTGEMFVPQMLNLDLIGGVSFTKGCYPGQEIVARVHYRGRIKERMFRAHVETPTAPTPGLAIHAPDMPGGQAAGNVVMAAAAPAGGFDLLVVVHLSSVQTGELRLGTDGPTLAIEPLPYPVPLES